MWHKHQSSRTWVISTPPHKLIIKIDNALFMEQTIAKMIQRGLTVADSDLSRDSGSDASGELPAVPPSAAIRRLQEPARMTGNPEILQL